MNPVTEALPRLLQSFESNRIEYIVGGSLASGAWSQPRQTNDIDIVARIDMESGRQIAADLGEAYMFDLVSLQNALATDEEYRSIKIFHLPTMFKVDLFIPMGDAFTDSVLRRRVLAEMSRGLSAYFYSAEDIVIQKMRWFVLGNQVSDRQWNDIVQVLEIQADFLDRSYMAKWATEFGIQPLLNKAVAEAGVVDR